MNKIEENLKEIKRKAELLNEAYESFLNTDIIKLAEQTQSLVKNLTIPVVSNSIVCKIKQIPRNCYYREITNNCKGCKENANNCC